jgi:hypothetical protein
VNFYCTWPGVKRQIEIPVTYQIPSSLNSYSAWNEMHPGLALAKSETTKSRSLGKSTISHFQPESRQRHRKQSAFCHPPFAFVPSPQHRVNVRFARRFPGLTTHIVCGPSPEPLLPACSGFASLQSGVADPLTVFLGCSLTPS